MRFIKKIIASCIFLVPWMFSGIAQQKTIQERLGYPKDTRLLIINADDIGVSHSENAGSIYVMEKGMASSGSIMIPCPWMGEIAAYARSHPRADFGLHLTLTSEWDNYKWGTVTPLNQASGLVNANGFFYSSVDSLSSHASPESVEKEIRAQIERARQFGIDATHFDSHMFSLFAKPEYLRILIRMGREYKVPVLLNREWFKQLFNIDVAEYASEKEVVVDKLFMAMPNDYDSGMIKYYRKIFRSMQPGLSCLLMHAAYDNNEMRAVANDHPYYGAAWRQTDLNFFTSAECRNLLKQQKIKVIGWREVRDKLFRN